MATNYPVLTEAAIARIEANERVDKPRLQIIVYKLMPENKSQPNAQKKIRFQMCDGVKNGNNFIAVLPELIQRIESGEFEKFTVIELTSYLIQTHQQSDRQIVIINDMSVVMKGSLIGKRLDKSDSKPSGSLSNLSSNANRSPNVSNQRLMNTSSAMSPASKSANKRNECPITAITPYFNAWLIKARVTSKSNKRNWSNARGEGSVFSFDVMDSSGEIRVNAFNQECEKYHAMIDPGKVYYISKGTVKTANKRFSNLSNDYEITLNSDSLVEECDESSVEVPKMRYKFIQIRDLANISAQSVVDVIGIIKSIEECVTINSKKTNKELKKRDLYLIDNTCHEVRFTLWADLAENFEGVPNKVMAIKNAVVGEYNGKTLSCVSNTTLQVEPEVPETNLLKDWYSREGSNVSTMALSKAGGEGGNRDDWKLLCQINAQTVSNENRSYFNVKGRIVGTGRNPLYKACGSNGCLKKVRDNPNGTLYCEKCNIDRTTEFQWRLILSVAISDCTAESWITLFQEQGEKLLGMSAQQLSELQEESPQQFLKALSSAEFKQFVFRIGSRMETYMDETKVKSVAYQFTPIDPIKQSKQLIKNIRQWTQ